MLFSTYALGQVRVLRTKIGFCEHGLWVQGQIVFIYFFFFCLYLVHMYALG